MFPDQLIPIILIIFLNVIFKSISDKKKIETAKKNRRKKNEELFRESKTLTEYDYDIEKMQSEKKLNGNTKYEGVKNGFDNKIERTYSFKTDKEETIDRSVNKGKESKNNKMNIKRDVLRGIIFSEILSEPKSIKKKRGI